MATAKNIILKNQQGEYLIPYVPNATESKTGLVKPDGTTITVDSNGIISADLSSAEVKIDNTTIVKDSDGKLKTVGVEAKTGEIVYNWIGTTAEYEAAVANGTIKNNWFCLITDAEEASNVKVDNATVVQNEDGTITVIGSKAKSGEVLYDWVGTTAEYEKAVSKGQIGTNWVCYITDAPAYTTSSDVATAISNHNTDSDAHEDIQDQISINSGYIADLQANKADKSDTYTRNTINSKLADKADWGTTLAHYGITDAATKTELTQLNFIKFVDSLPMAGENKYIYAVPQTEVDKDNKPIVLLYLWQNNEWNSVGAFSINIDPDTLATKEEVEILESTLQNSIDEKANSADLATVATSGSYNDLKNKPVIPTEFQCIFRDWSED